MYSASGFDAENVAFSHAPAAQHPQSDALAAHPGEPRTPLSVCREDANQVRAVPGLPPACCFAEHARHLRLTLSASDVTTQDEQKGWRRGIGYGPESLSRSRETSTTA